MRIIMLMILLPAVSFLFTYTTECAADKRSPLKVKENRRNLIFGAISAALVLVLTVYVYIQSLIVD